MFVPCVARRSINNQHYALNYVTQLGSTTNGTTTLRHTGHINVHYMIYHLLICISSNSDGSKKLPNDGRLLPKQVGACILNKGVI
jgi:hypothetical protein